MLSSSSERILTDGGKRMRNLKLKFRRIELDISQTDLAKKVGVTRRSV